MSQSLFSDDLLSFIDEWKNKPGNLIMVLHRVQSEIGYISREAADEVSRLLDVPLATIWGVVTFSLLQTEQARQVQHPGMSWYRMLS